MKDKIKQVAFSNEELKQAYLELKEGNFEDKKLAQFLDRAIDDLKNNPVCGIKIPKRIWPKIYIIKYKITNLWKYNLPNAWRLIYTIEQDEINIISMILEWFNHKDYERRFHY